MLAWNNNEIRRAVSAITTNPINTVDTRQIWIIKYRSPCRLGPWRTCHIRQQIWFLHHRRRISRSVFRWGCRVPTRTTKYNCSLFTTKHFTFSICIISSSDSCLPTLKSRHHWHHVFFVVQRRMGRRHNPRHKMRSIIFRRFFCLMSRGHWLNSPPWLFRT